MPKTSQTFFFYDLETSGLNPRDDRIMQFAGQRTDMALQPIGEPYNLLIAMSDDTLPSPDALMVTGITPQKTVEEGYSEQQFAHLFDNDIALDGTVFVGYNNVRFDDEFIRALLWRNYYDPYKWAYDKNRSRWDMLDVVRMTRALRPDGITWPMSEGKPSNRLELLSRENKLEHANAHDALSDVQALIEITKLIQSKQPQLFDYLFSMRDKNKVKDLVNLDQPVPFVYTSGRYDSNYHKTTVAYPLAEAENGNIYVYDLRYNPSQWLTKSSEEIEQILSVPYKERGDDYQSFPIKKLQYNHCPAVAPIGVLGQDEGWGRIGLTPEIITEHQQQLQRDFEFASRAANILNKKPDYKNLPDAENKIYDGFIGDRDGLRTEAVRSASVDQLRNLAPQFDDQRLRDMFARYKAQNFPTTLSDDERSQYERYRQRRISRQSPLFVKAMQRLLPSTKLSEHQQFVLEELKLWFESVVSEDTGDELGETSVAPSR